MRLESYMTFLVDFKGNLEMLISNSKFDKKTMLTQQPNPISGITDFKYLLIAKPLF